MKLTEETAKKILDYLCKKLEFEKVKFEDMKFKDMNSCYYLSFSYMNPSSKNPSDLSEFYSSYAVWYDSKVHAMRAIKFNSNSAADCVKKLLELGGNCWVGSSIYTSRNLNYWQLIVKEGLSLEELLIQLDLDNY